MFLTDEIMHKKCYLSKYVMVKLFPNVSVALEQIHISKTRCCRSNLVACRRLGKGCWWKVSGRAVLKDLEDTASWHQAFVLLLPINPESSSPHCPVFPAGIVVWKGLEGQFILWLLGVAQALLTTLLAP